MIPLPPTPSKKKSSFAPVELTCAPTKPALSLGISVWVMLKFGRTLRSISCSLLSTYSTNCHGKSLCLRQVEIKQKKLNTMSYCQLYRLPLRRHFLFASIEDIGYKGLALSKFQMCSHCSIDGRVDCLYFFIQTNQ